MDIQLKNLVRRLKTKIRDDNTVDSIQRQDKDVN
jgi:hypothetical protein